MRYICNTCGYKFDEFEEMKEHMKCPICKGKLISIEEYKQREEIQKNIEEDNEDDNFTPKQDATDEAVDLIIIEGMNKNIKELGNDGTFQAIEEVKDPLQRARYRQYFIKAGGYIPEGEAINI